MANYYCLLTISKSPLLFAAQLVCHVPNRAVFFYLEFGKFLYRGPFFLHVIEMGVYPRNGGACVPKP